MCYFGQASIWVNITKADNSNTSKYFAPVPHLYDVDNSTSFFQLLSMLARDLGRAKAGTISCTLYCISYIVAQASLQALKKYFKIISKTQFNFTRFENYTVINLAEF